MPHQRRILVVDDEPDIRKVLERYLRREGFLVEMAADGKTALAMIERAPPDLVVLDLIMPTLDGLEMTRLLRGRSDIPIIMLTSKDEELDKLVGLEMGADDYITKPFSVNEVVARVKTVLRRVAKNPAASDKPVPLCIGDLTVDSATRTILLKQQPVTVSAKQFDLLCFLASHPGQVFTREQLLNQVWGYDFYGDSRVVDVHVRRLREKIEPDSSRPQFILTVWGVGYKFADDVELKRRLAA
jgi:DNA-binding response OmpR family regulator